MKTIYHNISRALMLLAASASLLGILSSCDKETEPYATAAETDSPKILNTNLLDPKDGQPYGLPTIHRDENFKFDVIVTPAQYTTVEWFVNGEKVFEGNSIDMALIAGDYDVKILATTTKGLTTWRECSLTVLPLDSDPTLVDNPKNRWFTIGDTKTVEFSNTPDIAKMFLGGAEINGFTFENGKLTFTVPQMDEGSYLLVIQTADGTKYGCGKVTVSQEKYVDPGVQETVLWEGATNINWGDSNVLIPAAALEPFIGKEISLHFEIFEEEYHAVRVTTTDWKYDLVGQIDGFESYSSPFTFNYTAEHHQAVVERGGMLVVGFGYRLTKVSVMENVGPKEATLWEGEIVTDWDNSKVLLEPSVVAPFAGKQLVVYFEIVDAEYHSFRVINDDWSCDIVPQIDGFESHSSPYVIDYT
ncbi:MAG: hypothetical protein HUJ94_07615, partial [Bacteroidales bacterium]|nr:hypothetical protein [Bacteroidales bacterium]